MAKPLPELLRGKYALRILFKLDEMYIKFGARRGRLNLGKRGRSRTYLPPLPEPADLRTKLASASIERLFAAGPDEVCRIYDYVAEPWRSIFLGQRPRNLEQMVRLVALNLDWYLKPPRRLFRREWVEVLLGIAAGVLGASVLITKALTLGMGFFDGREAVPAMMFGFFPLALAFVFLFSPPVERHLLYINEFRNYVRELFRDRGVDVKEAEKPPQQGTVAVGKQLQ